MHDAQKIYDPNVEILATNMMAEWETQSPNYSELSVLLVCLKHLYTVHQTHHWQSKDDSFYGDHQLFSRLYGAVLAEIDTVAEKAIGLGSIDNVNPRIILAQENDMMIKYCYGKTLPTKNELAHKSLSAELDFLKITSTLTNSLKLKNNLTRGVDNMIAGIEDLHESHVYLLKQRCTQ